MALNSRGRSNHQLRSVAQPRLSQPDFQHDGPVSLLDAVGSGLRQSGLRYDGEIIRQRPPFVKENFQQFSEAEREIFWLSLFLPLRERIQLL